MKPTEEKKIWQAFSGSKFRVLLITIVLFLALRPFLEGSRLAFILNRLFFSLVVLVCVYSVGKTRRGLLIALSLGLPSVTAHWLWIFWENPSLHIASTILQVLFWGYTVTFIISHLFRVQEVSADIIMGAACSYFMIGFTWAFLFFGLESISPGSFSFPHPKVNGINDFVYYSFMTLTTVGFGDIRPVSDPARSLTILEAVSGQLFIATMIAILVGSYRYRSGENPPFDRGIWKTGSAGGEKDGRDSA
jgi:hypothetical protein